MTFLFCRLFMLLIIRLRNSIICSMSFCSPLFFDIVILWHINILKVIYTILYCLLGVFVDIFVNSFICSSFIFLLCLISPLVDLNNNNNNTNNMSFSIHACLLLCLFYTNLSTFSFVGVDFVLFFIFT